MPLRIVFAGTPDFAAASLDALLDTDHRIEAVLTQPDRPAGRNRKPRPSPVKGRALEAGLPVWQPESLRDDDFQARLRELAPDVMVVVAYGLIVPQAVLDIPRYGCINVHGSLLPRWRGAAPIQRAIIAGDRITGVTIMRMEAGLDTGPMLHSQETAITPDDTGGSLHDRLADMGARALVGVLEDLPGHLEWARPQPAEGVTYAHKLTKDEARLDWRGPADELARRIRAFNPWPVAWTPLNGKPLRLWLARPEPGTGTPGEVLAADDRGLLVAAGDGAVRLTRLQLPGGKAMAAADLLRGHPGLFEAGRPIGDD